MAPLIVEIRGDSSVLALREEGMKHALRSTAEARASEGPGFIERAGWREHECGIHSRDGPEGPGHAEEVSGSSLTFSLYAGRWQGDLVQPLITWQPGDSVVELVRSGCDAGPRYTCQGHPARVSRPPQSRLAQAGHRVEGL